ncbi:DUF3466 family protein [Shewanella eurypsychrophilus]|uniref:DUF3466 family protein n=1 Tax=Shewanella eurypsychrophilus TaxID=2593656 RepID=A0ABX6V8Q4_9GAMM|nr:MULTISPECIES: DUF3466 family protein [Shewanella]QFU23093.1 DUF3466 family protein [Shewanella sp. YLB-09]QPG58376.1 DUF3466 family protein [Shewanella eurypsychrophilus]
MKLKLDKALSLVALGVIGALQGVQAAPVYEIKNLDDIYVQDSESADLIGTLKGTRSGYGMAVNASGVSLGVSKGKKYLSVSDDDDGVIDIEDGIAPEEKIIRSINYPIKANNFTFTAVENDSSEPWLPVFDSVNGTTDPSLTDADDPDTINSVDVYYYGVNDSGLKVGSMTAEEETETYTGSTEGQEFWYYRDFEERGFVKSNDGVETSLTPTLTTYSNDDATVNIGGYSVAAKINPTGLVVGYVGTDISKNSKERLDSCIAGDTYPIVDICIQGLQFPYDDYGNTYINYQVRGYVWQVESDGAVSSEHELPLGLTPASDSTYIYTAQGLGVNSQGDVAGRSHVYRRGNKDKLAFDAAYWTTNTAGEYEYNWIDMIDDRYQSIAYDINDSGILVGSYQQYLDGYIRDKFFYFDTNNPESEIVTPNDFYNSTSDLSSKPKDINNKGQVVGFIETTHDKEKPRPKAGFLYNKGADEFRNLNQLLTCESKGFEKVDDKWQRRQVSVKDGTDVTLTYNEDLLVVEANSINEEGVIAGTVFVRKPQYKFDSDGNLVIGDNGLPVFEVNGYGDPLTSYLPRSVILKTNGTEATEEWLNANNCVDSNDDAEDYERKGAASFIWLFTLPLLWLRRRYK